MWSANMTRIRQPPQGTEAGSEKEGLGRQNPKRGEMGKVNVDHYFFAGKKTECTGGQKKKGWKNQNRERG